MQIYTAEPLSFNHSLNNCGRTAAKGKLHRINQIRAEALQALDAQGRAQLAVKSFKGSPDAESLIKNIKEISNDEYAALEQKFRRKACVLPFGLQRKTEGWLINKYNVNAALSIVTNKDLYDDNYFMRNYADIFISKCITPEHAFIADKILSDKNLYQNEDVRSHCSHLICAASSPAEAVLVYKILSDFADDKNVISNAHLIARAAENPQNIHHAEQIINSLHKGSLLPSQISFISKYPEQCSCLEKLNETIGLQKADGLSDYETQTGLTFLETAGLTDISKMQRSSRKKFLDNLTASNIAFYGISDRIKKLFPLLPQSIEEYSAVLSAAVNSICSSNTELTETEIEDFNKNLESSAAELAGLSDTEFNKLEIHQEYSRNDFIKDVFDNIKHLSEEEQQNICSHFGFGLENNEWASFKTPEGRGLSLTGCPLDAPLPAELNINPQTAENIRRYVIKFSKNNKIICSNKELEKSLNNIIKAIPELRPSMGCIQAGMKGAAKGAHKFDIFRHSLKVMQEIAKNPEFSKLNQSDKKILLTASLLHDISKKEGCTDPMHADTSSIDSFFIIRRFNLSDNEQQKLYNLIKTHEWLQYVNTAGTNQEMTKRQQFTAYDLRHENMFDMSLIFTHADLKGVNGEFHDKKDETRISKADGIKRSYGEAADFHAEKIKKYIEELKTTQPLLPVTPIPKADRIEKAVTEVHKDGSTNIKGVYKDKDGLIILKYNELQNEDLEKIGFPKGSTVSGIETETELKEKVDTGNIKFFVHGLEKPAQLAKFNAFSFIASDVLLSASWAERPESKYRFFRPQGVLLNCKTKYIHGGGSSDRGSGYGKTISEFKNSYIFGGEKEGERRYISDLIKSALNIDNEQYVQFVKAFENKSMFEIEPEEVRNTLIKTFAGINSNTRSGNREYNEFYISNPMPPMAVFAYHPNDGAKILNPAEYLNSSQEETAVRIPVKQRTGFLKEYALKHNIPFVIFGD